MIVVIGADGFLGNRLVAKLRDVTRMVSSHTCGEDTGGQDFSGTEVLPFTDTDAFFQFLPVHYREIEWVLYCDKRIPNAALSVFRYEFVQKLWTVAARYSVPLLYAIHQSMEMPESDFHPDRFVAWTGRQYQKPPFWYIFRVGEVYGRQEDMTGERTSRVYDFYRQIVAKGEVSLPESEKGSVEDAIVRDYLYVQDAVRVFYWFMKHRPSNGVYDLGSGFERSDLAVANAIFRALKLPPRIRYSSQNSVGDDSQHAPFRPDLQELRRSGYRKPFFSIEKGVKSILRKPL